MTKQCYLCAARDGEATFLSRKKPGLRRLCDDCIAAEQPKEGRIERPKILSRAAWRARARTRMASPQQDLLDWAQH